MQPRSTVRCRRYALFMNDMFDVHAKDISTALSVQDNADKFEIISQIKPFFIYKIQINMCTLYKRNKVLNALIVQSF